VPHQRLAVPGSDGEDELAGVAGGAQPLHVALLVRLLPRKRVEECAEFVQPALRIGDELRVQFVLRFGPSYLVPAVPIELAGDFGLANGEIRDLGQERRAAHTRDRRGPAAVAQDVHAGIAGRLLAEPELAVSCCGALEADHA